VAASESTTLTAYGDLTTPGPSVTVVVPASGTVLVSVTAQMDGNANSTSCLMSFKIGAAGASDANAVILAGSAIQRASANALLTGLAPGSTTFTAVYRADGTGSLNCVFSNRTIALVPLR
jgi:hypothetical protein